MFLISLVKNILGSQHHCQKCFDGIPFSYEIFKGFKNFPWNRKEMEFLNEKARSKFWTWLLKLFVSLDSNPYRRTSLIRNCPLPGT
jgi:hypothetical protein